MSFVPTGTVYGTLLNFRGEWDAWAQDERGAVQGATEGASAVHQAGQHLERSGADIPVPARVSVVEVGATIAMVMKAADEVAGYVLMNDISIPHDSFFRPRSSTNAWMVSWA